MDGVLDRIKKLLTLAERSDSESEREAALAAAQRIMLRHQIDVETASSHEIDRFRAVEESLQECSRERLDLWAASIVLCQCFGVRTFMRGWRGERRKEYRIFGAPEHVAVARYVFVFLSREFRRRWDAHRRRMGHSRGSRDYYAGMAQKVIDQLQREVRTSAERAALILISDQLERSWQRHHGQMAVKHYDPQSTGQFYAGLRDASDILVRTPLGGEAVRKLPHVKVGV